MNIKQEILNKIKEYNRIMIHGHIRPDGDCWGSQLGLKNIIKTSFPEKEVYAVGDICNYVSFLGKMDEVTDEMYQGALAICVDCGDGDRISDMRYQTADYIIKIDHHIPVKDYGDLIWVEEHKPACAQLIYEFYNEFKDELKMTKDGAMAIYTGILTDTGRFKYELDSSTFLAAAGLLDLGVDVTYIDNQLSIETLEVIKFKGYVLSHFKITKAGFAYIKITKEIVEKYGLTYEDAANQVGLISTLPDCPVWALFIEYPAEIRIRLRSRGPAVDILANKYQGGGHAKASGAKIAEWSMMKDFIKDADQVVLKYKEENQ